MFKNPAVLDADVFFPLNTSKFDQQQQEMFILEREQ